MYFPVFFNKTYVSCTFTDTFQSAVLTVAAFDAVTPRSRPPNCKLKQMLGEEKGLLLHNEGAVLWSGTRACRLSQTPKNSWREIHAMHDVCLHQNEISDGVKNRQDEKKSEYGLAKKKTFHAGVSDPGFAEIYWR